ncbi:MAG: ATP-dependent Clp protease ATP-binding subunit [Ruminococcaceae bacterium]|nr:ATP-dependent Clp protease ATP-binding subunit [Oscillospiraceae bacterium]
MVMCSQCNKRMAVVFVTKVENGEKKTKGLCLKCAKEMGVPIDNIVGNVMNQFGISPEQMENAEEEFSAMLEQVSPPSDSDDREDGGAPAIDLPKLFRDAGLFANDNGVVPSKNGDDAAKSTEKKDKKKGKEAKKLKFLPLYSRNLTQYAREGKLDKIIGRERELARVIQILCRRQKNNPCLIGEPGVGKTAIAEALAIRVAAGTVPYKLLGKEIHLLDMTALVAGTQFRGQFESRILGLLNEVHELGNVILVIDEVHNIVGTGEAEGSVNAANILKPALARGEVQIIGATTLNEYRKYIEKDTALERRFQPVTVNEPSVEESIEMLQGIKHYYEAFHGIIIPDAVLKKAVVLSERYITDRYLPDKAIDLLDEAAAYLSLSSAAINESYSIRDKLLGLKQKREELEGEIAGAEAAEQNRYEEIAKIRAEELKLSARLGELEPDTKSVELGQEEIANVIELWTGVPASSITENEFSQIDKLEARLKKRIIGQDAAVEAVSKAIKRNRAGISYKRKPVSFIFAGPTGVGKTELVKTLANDLFHSPETLIRLDMSEFMEKHSVSRIIGAPPGYVGYDEAGQLTEKIRRRPYSIVLFDEIEKAHPDVLNILLQILDDGRITDARGKTVNFENTVIVMTTNAGSDRTAALAGFSAEAGHAEDIKTQKALESFLRPEFINRVDEIITFRSLDEKDFEKIAAIMLEELKTALAEKDIQLSYTDAALRLIAEKSFSRKYGARNMRRYIQKEVEDALAELIIADYTRSYTTAKISARDEKIVIHCM